MTTLLTVIALAVMPVGAHSQGLFISAYLKVA